MTRPTKISKGGKLYFGPKILRRADLVPKDAIAKQAGRSYRGGAKDGMEQAIGTLFDEFVRIFGSRKAVLFLHWLEKKRLPTLLKELGKPNK